MSSDPTAFDIKFDPRNQRMRGTTVHKNMYFDVPFVSEITDNLWQGGCQNGLVLPQEVKHLVSLYPWEAYDLDHELDSALTVRLYDDLSEINNQQIYAIAQWVNVCRKTGITLVHCQAGLNRSSLVAGLALVRGDGMGGQEAIDLLREKRSPAVLCNPSFERHLQLQDMPSEG